MNKPSRVRRILQKVTQRVKLAAWMLRSYEDTIPRSVCKVSFAQSGEDVIAWMLSDQLGITHPRYLDIGAHHPFHLSNTALFHLHGARGMTIEPDAHLHRAFTKHRPGDINLNLGIGTEDCVLTFYRMADPTLNTFSREEALAVARDVQIPIVEEIQVPVRPIAQVLDEHGFKPDFLSLDVEGKDLDIMRSYDFARHRPAVICAETVSFTTGEKNQELIDYVVRQGYRIYADTHINTLFVDAHRQRA